MSHWQTRSEPPKLGPSSGLSVALKTAEHQEWSLTWLMTMTSHNKLMTPYNRQYCPIPIPLSATEVSSRNGVCKCHVNTLMNNNHGFHVLWLPFLLIPIIMGFDRYSQIGISICQKNIEKEKEVFILNDTFPRKLTTWKYRLRNTPSWDKP